MSRRGERPHSDSLSPPSVSPAPVAPPAPTPRPQGTYALHVYLAVGGATARDLDSGGPAQGATYGAYPDGGDYAGGASGGYMPNDARYDARYAAGGNGNGGLRGTYFDRYGLGGSSATLQRSWCCPCLLSGPLSHHPTPSHLLCFVFGSPFLEPGTEAVVRVDAMINFTWGLGRITPTGTDFVSVRWEGAVRPPSLAEAGVAASASSIGRPAGTEDYSFMVTETPDAILLSHRRFPAVAPFFALDPLCRYTRSGPRRCCVTTLCGCGWTTTSSLTSGTASWTVAT